MTHGTANLPKSAVVLGAAALLFALAAPAAAGQGPAPSLLLLGAPNAQAFIAGAVATAKKDPIGDPAAQSTCFALCGDGTEISCWGSTCNATDNACSVDPSQVGHCWGSSTGTKSCSECPPTTSPCQRISCNITNGTSCEPGSASFSCTTDQGDCGTCQCDFGTWMCTL